MLATFAAPLLLASSALAHVKINYPLGERDFEESTQETGAFCAGASFSNASAWGTQDAFISLSGDAGQQITVLWAVGSASAPPTVSGTSDFSTTLLANATFPESGNFCFNTSNLNTASLTPGTIGTLYVQAVGEGANVSSCADVAIIPSLSIGSTIVMSFDGQQVVNPSTGNPVSYFDYYCSNGTVLALDTCDCHCHGPEGHCSTDCSEARVAESNAQCAAAASGTVAASSAVPAASSAMSVAASASSFASSVAAAANSAASSAAPAATSAPASGGFAVASSQGFMPLVGASLVGLAAILI